MHQWRKPDRLHHWRIVEKARTGGIFANNCDSDVSNPQHTGYIKYYWTHLGCLNVHWRKRFTSLVRESRWQRSDSNMECFLYNYTIINCLLTICLHNYYTQPIYTDVSKCCESLTDWSIPLSYVQFFNATYIFFRQKSQYVFNPCVCAVIAGCSWE